jgi:Protein of unknown function (DUF2818)
MGSLIPSWAILAVLAVALVGANLPFINQRIFVLGPKRSPKPALWHVIELVVYAAIAGIVGRSLEGSIGQVAPQRWEFYAIWFSVMVTLAFPGFVWRFLRRNGR